MSLQLSTDHFLTVLGPSVREDINSPGFPPNVIIEFKHINNTFKHNYMMYAFKHYPKPRQPRYENDAIHSYNRQKEEENAKRKLTYLWYEGDDVVFLVLDGVWGEFLGAWSAHPHKSGPVVAVAETGRE